MYHINDAGFKTNHTGWTELEKKIIQRVTLFMMLCEAPPKYDSKLKKRLITDPDRRAVTREETGFVN